MKDIVCKLKRLILDVLDVGQAVEQEVDEKQEFLNQIRKAHNEWQIAVNNFNYSIDPDLVDYSIYNIESAEKRYVYFLKKARRENITVELPLKDQDFAININNEG